MGGKRKSKWQSVIDQALDLKGIDLTGKFALPAAIHALEADLSERDCIVKLGLEGHHPLAVREAMKKAGYFKSRNKQSATSLIYCTFGHHNIKVSPLDDAEINKRLPRGAVMYNGKLYAGRERIEMIMRLAEFLHKPTAVDREGAYARRRDPMEKAG